MAFQTVKVEIDVEVDDDAKDGVGEHIVANALLTDERIKLVYVTRRAVLVDAE